MSRDEARATLRELLGPLRERAVREFEVPDIQDAFRLLSIDHDPDLFGDEAMQDLERLVTEAGFDIMTPLGDLFEKED